MARDPDKETKELLKKIGILSKDDIKEQESDAHHNID